MTNTVKRLGYARACTWESKKKRAPQATIGRHNVNSALSQIMLHAVHTEQRSRSQARQTIVSAMPRSFATPSELMVKSYNPFH